jgi:hypothetical protein
MCAVAIWTSEEQTKPKSVLRFLDSRWRRIPKCGSLRIFRKVSTQVAHVRGDQRHVARYAAAVARKDQIDRRLGWRNVDSHGSCEHVPHTSNAIGVTPMLAAGYILAISLSARSTGKHDPNCANDADIPRGKFIGKQTCGPT